MDNDEVAEHVSRIEEWAETPQALAAMEQAQAQFMDDMYMIMTFVHAASLSAIRSNRFTQALASQQLAAIIDDLEPQRVRLIIMKMASAIVRMNADLEHGGDLEAAIAAASGPEDFLRIEGYIATNGDLCLFCGERTSLNNDGVTHYCQRADDDDAV